MLVRNSERSKALFERLDSMASESWVGPHEGFLRLPLPALPLIWQHSACRPLLEEPLAHHLWIVPGG